MHTCELAITGYGLEHYCMRACIISVLAEEEACMLGGWLKALGIKTHGSVSCAPHREYINRNNKNAIFTHA